MAKFMYVGDPNDNYSGPETIVQNGIVFAKGDAVDVPEGNDKEKAVVEKLRDHSHFVDMSDQDEKKEHSQRMEALKKAEKDRAAAEAERQKQEAKQEEERLRLARRASGTAVPPDTPGIRPPGRVTREPVTDPFGGRTVEERTRAEDHTQAGKTKG